jgi:nucleoside-diphosphate-sugar epimerase
LTEPENHNEIYNIGNPDNLYSMKDLAEIVIKQLDSDSKIVYDKIRYDTDVYVRVPDIEKIKRKLNWTPTTGIEDIINVCASFATHDM